MANSITEEISHFLYATASWGTCPIEIKLTKDAWLRVYRECMTWTLFPDENKKKWEGERCIEINGPSGSVRVVTDWAREKE